MSCCGRGQKVIIGNQQVDLPTTASAATAAHYEVRLPSGEAITKGDDGKPLGYIAAHKLARKRGGRIRERRGR